MKSLGIKEVKTGKLNNEEYNAILEIFERENNFRPLNINKFSAGYRNTDDLAFYRPFFREISVNLKTSRAYKYKELKPFNEQLIEYKKILSDFDSKYLGNKNFRQVQVQIHRKQYLNKINSIEEKISKGEKAIHWITSHTEKDYLSQIKKTMVHEIGS